MLLNSLILLLLSNSITSRRDKSTLYSRAIITILLGSFFIPLYLEWSRPHFCILVLLNLATIISLSIIYNSPSKKFYYNGDTLAVFTGYYLSLIEKTVAHSPFNDTFLSINITIGLSMIILGLLNQETESVKDKIIFIMNNKKFTFILILVMFLVIFTINMLLLLIGLGVTVDTSSPTLFMYTFFPKVISIKLIFSVICCYITREFKLNNISLSIPSILLIFLTGSINCFYVVPYIKVVILLCLTKLDSLYTYGVEIATTKSSNDKSLAVGFFGLISKAPFIGKYVSSFTKLLHYNSTKERSSPFREYYTYAVKNLNKIHPPLTKISKFTPVSMPIVIVNKVQVSYVHKGTINNLAELLRNNSLYLTGFISNFVSNYSNLTCKINLRCDNQFVTISTTYINGHLEEFNLNRTNLNFANPFEKKGVSNTYSNSKFKEFSSNSFETCSKYNRDYPYDTSKYRTRELLHLTDPSYNGSNLQVFMQQGTNTYGYPIQEGSPSTGEASYLNRGVKRPLESENDDIHQSTDIPNIYPCINIKMINLQDKESLFLSFDSAKLTTERDKYLDEICFMGRTVLFDHYNSWINDSTVVDRIVETYTFEDLVFPMDNTIKNLGFYKVFFERYRHIIESNNIEPNKIYPFSNLYLDNYEDDSHNASLDNSSSSDHPPISDNLISNDLSSTEAYTDLGQNNLTDEDILILTKEIKIRMQNLFIDRRSRNDSLQCCVLLYIGFFEHNGIVLEGSNEVSVFTKLLGKLADEHPELLKVNGELYIGRTSVRNLYYKLRDLIRKPLTKEEILFLISGLESRRDKIPTNLPLILGNIIYTNGQMMLEKYPDLAEQDFTLLLENLFKEKPGSFLKNRLKTKISGLIDNLRRLLDN